MFEKYLKFKKHEKEFDEYLRFLSDNEYESHGLNKLLKTNYCEFCYDAFRNDRIKLEEMNRYEARIRTYKTELLLCKGCAIKLKEEIEKQYKIKEVI